MIVPANRAEEPIKIDCHRDERVAAL